MATSKGRHRLVLDEELPTVLALLPAQLAGRIPAIGDRGRYAVFELAHGLVTTFMEDPRTATRLNCAIMAIRRAVLVIADISGYTRYMHWNRMHLAHAQRTVAGLLESVIDAGKGLKLAKLEGDAAFFWAPNGDAKVLVCHRLSGMRQSFLTRRERMKRDLSCDCASCAQLDNLALKFVAHEGEVAEQRVKRHVELAGVDVILVHRMLKNDVPVPEYVLMTDPVAVCLDESVRQLCKPLTHDFEGIGQTSTHYLDLATSEVPPAVPARNFAGRLSANLNFELSALPFVLGIRKPAAGFRHLDRGTTEEPPGGLSARTGPR